MEKTTKIITVASWEPRFILGMNRHLDNHLETKDILMFFIAEYFDWSEDNIKKLRSVCNQKGIELEEVELSFKSPSENWIKIKAAVEKNENKDEFLLDFTTMPRSIIWYVLFFFNRGGGQRVKYSYHKAGDYNEEWLSRNPDLPRLLYKLSGISYLGRPTLLLVFAGYDPERVDNLIQHYEPQLIILILQNTEEFKNQKYRKIYQEKFGGRDNYQTVELDTFDVVQTELKLKETLLEFTETHNIVITSLGPKTSAIPIFNYVIQNKDIGLCYVPSKEFNKDYSVGIGDEISGFI